MHANYVTIFVQLYRELSAKISRKEKELKISYTTANTSGLLRSSGRAIISKDSGLIPGVPTEGPKARNTEELCRV